MANFAKSSIIAFCLWAEDISVVMPTTKGTNYVLYPVSMGVFLLLDTRDGTIIGIAPALIGARVKNKTYRSVASLGKASLFYDISTSKEYEVETGGLTSDECRQLEQMLTSCSVRVPFGSDATIYDTDFFALLPILITDYTSEISNSDDKLNKVKFTWRYADNIIKIRTPQTPGIFNDKYNPVFS